MNTLRRLQRHLAPLVAMACLAVALAPTLTFALGAPAGSSVWVEVCTAKGTQWVPLSDEAPTSLSAATGHCVLCAASASTALPPPPVVALAVPERDAPGAAPRCVAGRSSSPWPSVQARAPPAVP